MANGKRQIRIIVAVDHDGGFAKDGAMPWNFPDDLKRFQTLTKNHVCVMGRRTFDDIYDRKPKKTAPLLPGRTSYVLSSNESFGPLGAKRGASLSHVLHDLPVNGKRTVFVIGGQRLFDEALKFCNGVDLTIIPGVFNCDQFFDVKYLYDHFEIAGGEENADTGLKYLTYERKK